MAAFLSQLSQLYSISPFHSALESERRSAVCSKVSEEGGLKVLEACSWSSTTNNKVQGYTCLLVG